MLLDYTIYHICIFTNDKNTEFIVCGGETALEINSNLALLIGDKNVLLGVNKLVYQKTYMLKEEGERFESSIKKLPLQNKRKLIMEDNPDFVDFTKNLEVI